MVTVTESYDSLAERLSATASPMDPAEIHGRLCGYICATRQPRREVWLTDATLDLAAEDGELKQKLVELWESTLRVLDGEAFEFEPLLPSLDSSLDERVDALSNFGSGFIAGLSLAGKTGAEGGQTGSHLEEFVADVREISRVALDDADTDDEGDFAYAELVEYLRAGIQLCWDELRSSDSDAPPNSVH